jgi:hypothetical protein
MTSACSLRVRPAERTRVRSGSIAAIRAGRVGRSGRRRLEALDPLDVRLAPQYLWDWSIRCTNMVAENSARKQRGKPFPIGVSGNPQGKSRGARNRILMALDRIGEDAAEDVLRAAVERAKGGDARTAEMIFSGVWPHRKGRPVILDLPPIVNSTDLVGALASVAGAVGGGVISPDEGQAVAAMLEAQRRAIETVELEARIAALEQREEQRR